MPLVSSFNTQPPEGGWSAIGLTARAGTGFNTQPPEGGWARHCAAVVQQLGFNTQPPEGGWDGIRVVVVVV